MNKSQVIAVMLSSLFLATIVSLIKREKLKEEYSIFWLLTGAFILLAAIWKRLIFFITDLFGVGDANTTIFFFSIFLLLVLAFFFTLRLSALSKQMVTLIQDTALLRKKADDMEKGARRDDKGPSS